VLFCTHIIPDVEALCDSVAVLVGGRRVREGTVQELLTGQSPLVEVTVAGLGRAALAALGFGFSQVQEMQDRVRLRVSDADAQPFLRTVLEKGGKVTEVTSARFSLEDLFLKELEGAKQSVGGEIS
jgi:ABC-2 type transport system ATP-binding protein